jgi:hypothetical protein
MRGAALALCALLGAGAAAGAEPDEPFPAKGGYNGSVHRFFPDLDARLNAVRYGRWRALEIAWTSGINPTLDREYSSYLEALLADPPRFPPEAERVAPIFAREAIPVFRAIRWGQVLEQQVLDVLASSDATPSLIGTRLTRVLDLYRRERWAISEPDEPATPSEAARLAPFSARILISGTRLLVVAAEDLVASDFGEQRWRVRRTVSEFDSSFTRDRPRESSTFPAAAPTVSSRYPVIGQYLDRLARFRAEVFDALAPGGHSSDVRQARNDRVRQVARRYRLPEEGIGGR